MRAIILCGGRGERLMPLTEKTPAALLRIVGKELILNCIEQLVSSNICKITLAVGYGSKQIRSFVEQNFKSLEIFSKIESLEFSQCPHRGTAAAIKYAAKGEREDFLLIEANRFFQIDLSDMIKFHKTSGSFCTAAVNSRLDSDNPVMVNTDSENNIKEIVKQPADTGADFFGNLCGIYILNPEILNNIDFAQPKDFFEDILKEIIDSPYDFKGFSTNFYSKKILTAAEFLSCQQNILYSNGIKINNQANCEFNGVSIIPPVYIGENVIIEPGCVIEKGSVIDDGAHIGFRSAVKGAYIGKNVFIGDFCETDSCVICQSSLLGARVKCGYGAVIGCNSTVESDAEISPKSVIWGGCKIRKASRVSGKVDHKWEKADVIDDDGIFYADHNLLTNGGVFKFGCACASSLNLGQIIAVGHSDKNGGWLADMMFKSGVCLSGGEVFDLGECTKSQVINCVNSVKASLGIFIKMDSNCKIHVFSGGGIPIKRDLEIKIENSYEYENFRKVSVQNLGKIWDSSAYKKMYSMEICKVIPDSFKGINAQIRTNDNQIADIYDKIIQPRNDISGERIIFNISADGEKCTAYSDKTGNISWEKLVCTMLNYRFSKGKSAVVSWHFPTAADIIAEDKGGKLYRYYNNSQGEIDKFARKAASCWDNMFFCDGLALAVGILEFLSNTAVSLYDIIVEIPNIYTVQRYAFFNLDENKKINKLFKNHHYYEGGIYENENARALVSPLKNGMGAIIYAESFMSEQAGAICDELMEKIKKIENNGYCSTK